LPQLVKKDGWTSKLVWKDDLINQCKNIETPPLSTRHLLYAVLKGSLNARIIDENMLAGAGVCPIA